MQRPVSSGSVLTPPADRQDLLKSDYERFSETALMKEKVREAFSAVPVAKLTLV